MKTRSLKTQIWDRSLQFQVWRLELTFAISTLKFQISHFQSFFRFHSFLFVSLVFSDDVRSLPLLDKQLSFRYCHPVLYQKSDDDSQSVLALTLSANDSLADNRHMQFSVSLYCCSDSIAAILNWICWSQLRQLCRLFLEVSAQWLFVYFFACVYIA